jgi:hypothetical protein
MGEKTSDVIDVVTRRRSKDPPYCLCINHSPCTFYEPILLLFTFNFEQSLDCHSGRRSAESRLLRQMQCLQTQNQKDKGLIHYFQLINFHYSVHEIYLLFCFQY